MSVTASELAAIGRALKPRLLGARIRKIHQPRPHELVLGLRAPEGNVRLLLSLHPRHARMHLLEQPRVNPRDPSPLVMTLRREIDGARLDDLTVTPGDRVVTLSLWRGPVPLRLVAELFGGRAAVVLTDADGRVSVASRAVLASGRTARPGEIYVPPDAPDPAPAEDLDPATVHLEVTRREEEAEASLDLEDLRRRHDRPLGRELKRVTKLIRRLEQDAEKLPDVALCRRRGEAMRSALHEVPRGAAEVTLTEWTEQGPRPLDVPLDPRRDPRDNMERWFHRARRSERAAKHIATRLTDLRRRRAEIEARREEIRATTDPTSLGPAPEPATPRTRPADRTAGVPCFTSAEGFDILVGRSAAENDRVTFRLARGGDTWLHVRDRPGSHVVIRTPSGRTPSLESLLDAATLAVHHSSARGSSGVEVSYTLRKHVHRMRGAPVGTVSLSGEKSLRMDPDEARLERLYGTRREVTAP